MTAHDLSPTRWSARTLHHVGTFLAVVAVLGLIVVVSWLNVQKSGEDLREKQRTDRLAVIESDARRLAAVLDAQRQQFATCANRPVRAPGCITPVAPPARSVAPTIVTGRQGPAGPPGAAGAPGAKGTTGQSAFPFSFVFTTGDRTFTCTMTTTGAAATCTTP